MERMNPNVIAGMIGIVSICALATKPLVNYTVINKENEVEDMYYKTQSCQKIMEIMYPNYHRTKIPTYFQECVEEGPTKYLSSKNHLSRAPEDR